MVNEAYAAVPDQLLGVRDRPGRLRGVRVFGAVWVSISGTAIVLIEADLIWSKKITGRPFAASGKAAHGEPRSRRDRGRGAQSLSRLGRPRACGRAQHQDKTANSCYLNLPMI